MHYYPFNIADFNLHTAHLTLEEEAVYRRLIDFYYDTEKPIPKETNPVIRRLRLGSYVSEFEQILAEFFTLEDDGWHSYRCDVEIKAYHDKAEKARANGRKGGRPPKNKGKETKPVNLANPDLTQSKANQELITNNHKPLTKENRGSRFAPPTQQEAGNYFLERGSPDAVNEADKFIDFYASKNWMVGKNKMKDWKAAIRNWMRKSNENTQRSNQPSIKQRVGDAIHGATANDW